MASVAGNDTHLIAAPWTGMGARHWLIRRATFRAQKKVCCLFSSFHCILAVVSVPELFAFPCSLPPAHISQCVWA